ncbi:sensor histidine kinase [Parafrigoribacterium soli]|uniref:sensor histidine kinase n=1 Tax=Parafrigoribacterium soli TaxID=3144663 RepID=UPI0032F043E3
MSWFRRLSIRWRITIGSVAVGAVLLTSVAYAFRAQIEQVQINSDKKLLYGASTPYIAQIQNHPAQIDRPAGEEHVAVVNPGGTIVASNLPDSLEARMTELRTLNSGSNFVTYGRTHYLVIVRIVDTDAGQWHIIATRDQATTAFVLGNLTNILIIGALILLAGFGLASWLLTTAALRPVTQMRRRAESLIASGSPEPLPVGPARDELAELATTLNEFILSLRETAAREKQMVSDASHELRTPLSVLKAQLELAHLSEGDATALAADLRLAEDSVNRLSRLATNLLALSALEADHESQSAPWPALVAEFVDASDRARLLAQDKAISVEFEIDDRASDAEYQISTTHFAQVIDNLISNALRAVPHSGRVHAAVLQADDQMTLTVDDSGPGMPPDFIAVALDRFTRPDRQRGAATGGSGLGLSIVSTIVSRSKGEVRLANRPEGGFSVTVTIPQSAPGNPS